MKNAKGQMGIIIAGVLYCRGIMGAFGVYYSDEKGKLFVK